MSKLFSCLKVESKQIMDRINLSFAEEWYAQIAREAGLRYGLQSILEQNTVVLLAQINLIALKNNNAGVWAN